MKKLINFTDNIISSNILFVIVTFFALARFQYWFSQSEEPE